jgi:hypothetical protein
MPIKFLVYLFNLLRNPARPRRPEPIRIMVAGSGMAEDIPVYEAISTNEEGLIGIVDVKPAKITVPVTTFDWNPNNAGYGP